MCARAHSTADPSVAGGGGRRIRWGPRLRCPRTSPRTSKRTPLAAALLRLPPPTHAHTRLISLPPPLPPQEVFAPFASHPRYADLTDNIGRVTEFFNRKVEESVAASGGQLSVDRWGGGGGGVGGIGLAGVWRERGVGSAECCRARCGRVHIVSGSHKGSTEAASSGAFHPSCPPPPPPLPRPNCVRRVLDVIKQHSRGWRRDRLKPFPELRFTYEEGECRGGIRCDVCVRSEEGMWGLWREAVRVPPGTRCVGGGSGGKGGVTSQPAQPHRALTHAALACVHTRTRPLPRALCPAETPLTLTPPTPPPPPPPPHPIHAHRGQPRGVLCAVCVEPGGGARRRALDPACHHALHAHRCAEAGAGRGGAERGGGGGGGQTRQAAFTCPFRLWLRLFFTQALPSIPTCPCCCLAVMCSRARATGAAGAAQPAGANGCRGSSCVGALSTHWMCLSLCRPPCNVPQPSLPGCRRPWAMPRAWRLD